MTDNQAPHSHHKNDHKHGHNHSDDAENNHFGPGSEERLTRSDQFYKSTDRKIIEWLPLEPGNAALDAGCGAAGFAELLAEKVGDTGTIDAADTSTHLLEHNQERLANDPIGSRIRFYESSIDNLPFGNASYDLVWSSRAVHHLADPPAGVRELARVLNPGGTLALREGGLPARFLPDTMQFAATGLNERLAGAAKQWMAGHVHFDEEDGHAPYPFGWTQMLRDAGLTDVSAKTFILEFMPPFSNEQQEHLLSGLTRWSEDEGHRELISQDDLSAVSQLIDPNSPEYVFNRPDLHYTEGITIYTAKAR